MIIEGKIRANCCNHIETEMYPTTSVLITLCRTLVNSASHPTYSKHVTSSNMDLLSDGDIYIIVTRNNIKYIFSYVSG